MVREYSQEEYLNISYIYNLKKKVSYLRSVNFYQKKHKGKGKAIGQRCNNPREDRAI